MLKGVLLMLMEAENDKLTFLIKSNPDFEYAIEKLIEENKRTTSMFVHELRNPLSLMKGTIQYIESKHPETKEFKYWEQLHDLVNDLEQMMVDASLLNTCSILNKENHNLLELLQCLLNSYMPQAIERNINLILDITPGCETFFTNYCCDINKLKQVFSNLIKNAFEATSPGNFIRIGLDYIPEEDQSLSKLFIEISNNGQRIPEDEIETIFIPFVTYKKGGTGVGLAIVKKIIDLHFGNISVTSTEELTSFLIQLPY